MSTIGYKQIIEHMNDLPKIKTKILNLSNICRYIDGTKDKSYGKDRYYFDITVNGGGLSSAYKHICYFDDKFKAESLHKDLRTKYYDQETKPFLQKIASKHFLTYKDKEKIEELFAKIDKIKQVEEVILRK